MQSYMLSNDPSTILWTIYYTMDHLLYYGPSTILWTIYYTMDHLLYYGPSTILWTIYYTMDHLLYYGPSTILWTIYYTMDHPPYYGHVLSSGRLLYFDLSTKLYFTVSMLSLSLLATTKVVPASPHVASPRKASLPVLDDRSALSNPSNLDLEDESSPSDLKIVVKFLEKADSYVGQQPILDTSVTSTFVQVLREEILANGASVSAHDSFEHLLRALKAQPEVAPSLLASEADRIKLFGVSTYDTISRVQVAR